MSPRVRLISLAAAIPLATSLLGVGAVGADLQVESQTSVVTSADSGNLFEWGSTSEGILDGSSNSTIAIPLAAGENSTGEWTQVVGGTYWKKGFTDRAFTCGLDGSGAAYCMGSNEYGQLGDGTGGAADDSSLNFVAVANGESGGVFTHIAADGSTCALDPQGAAFCWGWNGGGQIGDGSTDDALVPTAVQTGAGTGRYVDIAVGTQHTCGVGDDSAMYCWGSNQFGQLGTGDTNDSLSPVAVLQGQDPGTYRSVVAGFEATCALGTDDSAYCWGRDQFGQIGNGGGSSDADFDSPQAVLGSAFTSITMGTYHACGLAMDDSAYCWGRNYYGQLGDGSTIDRTSPVRVSSSVGFRAITAHGSHTCAIGLDDAVYCWGINQRGQLGDGTMTDRNLPTPITDVAALSGRKPLAISGRPSRTYLIAATPSIAAEPASTSAFVGEEMASVSLDLSGVVSGATVEVSPALPPGLAVSKVDGDTFQISGTPQRLDVQRTYTATVMAGDDSVVSTTFTIDVHAHAGAVFGWGHNRFNVLTVEDTSQFAAPIQASAGANSSGTYVDIATGVYHSCGVGTDDSMYCWGDNQYGGLGNGSTADSSMPGAVAAGEAPGSYTQVAAGYYFTCGLGTDDLVYCWGRNSDGELGDGSTSNTNSPVATLAGDGPGQYRQVASGFYHSCGLGTDDSVYCWGDNTFRQLGDGSNTDRTSPVAIQAGSSPGQFRAMSAGAYFTCGIGIDDSVYCWGDNDNGQLGDGTTTVRSTPIAVSVGEGPGSYVSVTTGIDHTCALGVDDAVYCWGDNSSGQLGDGTTTDRTTPVAVLVGDGLTGVRSISAGSFHTCAISDDYTTYCWGENGNAELGDGGTSDRTVPTAVTDNSTYGPVVPRTLTLGGNGSDAGYTLALATVPAVSPSTQSVSVTVGQAITSTQALTGSGFVGSVSYAISPALPAGLAIASDTGVMSGTPTASQESTTYTITATGSVRGSATATVTIAVASALIDPPIDPAPPFVPAPPAPQPTEPPTPVIEAPPVPVPPGESLAVIGGEPVSVERISDRPDRETLRIGESTFSIEAPGRTNTDDPVTIEPQQPLQLNLTGLAPGSSMNPVWVFNTPETLSNLDAALSVPQFLRGWAQASDDDSQILLPPLTVSEDGTLDDSIVVPEELPVGDAMLQLAAVNADGQTVSVFFGVSVAEAPPAASILISGTRGEVRGRPGIKVTGTTQGLVGERLMPRVRFPGGEYFDGAARRTVAEDGTFTWQRRTGKKIYVIMKTVDGNAQSPRIIIRAPKRG